MSVSCSSGKRKQESSFQNQRKPPKVAEGHISTITPAFWDSLSRIWLTRRALKEFDRRSRLQRKLNKPSKLQLQLQLQLQSQSQFYPPLTHGHLEDISQIAKNGGLDLTDLRGFPEPRPDDMQPSRRGPTSGGSAPDTRVTGTTTTKTKNSGPHDQNFEELLIQNGIFPYDYCFPDGPGPGRGPRPGNYEEMRRRALRPRPSLSSLRFADADFEAFKIATFVSKNEKAIMTNVIPIIEGNTEGRGRRCADRPLNNFRPIVPGIVCGTPDICHGANPEDANLAVRRELGDKILPSTKADMPMAPNFFLEVKSAKGRIDVAERQALHTGALGERAQIALRSWRRERPAVLDYLAHTITVIYHNGQIQIHSIHAERSRTQADRTEFYMYLIFTAAIIGDAESFRRGVSAYRNHRDFAEEQRNVSIAMANEMALKPRETIENCILLKNL